MDIQNRFRNAWLRLTKIEAADGDAKKGERKTSRLPSIFAPYHGAGHTSQNALPKPTPANLRKFAETPVVRRAINIVKDRIASMDWQVRIRRGYNALEIEDAADRMNILRRCLEEPNTCDSFRVLWEQVLEDLLVGGFGAVEMEATGDPPEGGGFEVRRRESGFGSTSGTDFVLQSTVRSFSIPREAAVERYFVRMYDGSTTPVYSRFASAVFMDLPVGSIGADPTNTWDSSLEGRDRSPI